MSHHVRFSTSMISAMAAILASFPASTPVRAEDGPHFVKTPLVSNVPGVAANTDAKLVNPWGVSFLPGGPFWVSDNGTGVSTIYGADGSKIPLIVVVPGPKATPGAVSSPTGQVANSTSDFLIPSNPAPAPALFIFATEDGTISAWNRAQTDPTKAVLMVDNSATGAVYKGLASGTSTAGNFLFATNFRSGKVEVYDANFKPVAMPANAFMDPELPASYAPFGIANVNGDLFVTYALQDAQKHDEVPGPGKGFVDVFSTSGVLLRRLHGGRALNAPWGVTLAPVGFGAFGGKVLVGNFGDGHISVFSPTGHFEGQLGADENHALAIDGLWALTFAADGRKTNPDTLYYAAGVNGEKNGEFGEIVQAHYQQDR